MPRPTTIDHHPPPAKIYPPPPTPAKIYPPPPTTSQNISTTTHYHPPPAKIYPPPPNTSPKMDHHPAKAKIYSYITCSWHCFNMQYCFPWRRFCMTKFWSVRFLSSKILLTFRSSHRRCSVRIGVVRNFAIHKKTPVPESLFLIKLQAWGTFLIKLQAWNFFKKETLAQVFSCEFCEISRSTFFTEHLLPTASVDFTIFEIF